MAPGGSWQRLLVGLTSPGETHSTSRATEAAGSVSEASEASKLRCALKAGGEASETMFAACRAGRAPGGIRALFISALAGSPREEEITLSLVSALL